MENYYTFAEIWEQRQRELQEYARRQTWVRNVQRRRRGLRLAFLLNLIGINS